MKISFSLRTHPRDVNYILFCTAWTLYSISSFLGATELKFMFRVDKISLLLQLCVMVLSVAGVFLKARLTIIKSMAIVGTMALMAVITLFTRSYGYATIACLMMLGQLTDLDRIIRFDLIVKCVLFFSTVLLTLIGAIPNYMAVINGVSKHAYGFTHPNTFCVIAYVILLEWLYIRWSRWNIKDLVCQIACIGIISAVGGSRTTTYAYIFIIAVSMIIKLFPKLLYNRLSKTILPFSPLVMTAVSYLLVYLYGKKVRFVVKLNEVITSRFSSGHYYLTQYGASLFGQKIETVSTREAAATGASAMILDSTYIRLSVVMGCAFLILFVVMYIYILKKALDEKRAELVVYVLFFLIIGFSESYTLGIYNNLSLIFLMGYIAREKLDIQRILTAVFSKGHRIVIEEGDYDQAKR